MLKDSAEVARRAAEQVDADWRFRSFVRMLPRHRQRQINQLAEELGRAAEAEMDCRTCGACCRDNWVPVDEAEAERLATRLSLPVLQFQNKYLITDPDGETGIDAKPCPLLAGTTCSVYEDRPEVCRGYPYIGGDITSRMLGIIERAGVCPIVYAMLDGLKARLGFR